MRESLFAMVSQAVPVARHLALLAFGLTIALAAWPPANELSWGAGAGRFWPVSRTAAW